MDKQAGPIPSAAKLASWGKKAPGNAAQFPTLEAVTSPMVATADASYYLNRRPQTLRGWASAESGPLRPIRICGRLAWSTAEIRRLLGVQA